MLFLISLTAFGQEFTNGATPDANGQLFRPTIDGQRTLWADDSTKAPNGYFQARGLLHYANRPVVYAYDDGETLDVVSDIFQLSVLGGYTAGPLRIGLDIPVYLRSAGIDGGETGLGDVAVDVKGTILDGAEKAVGFALGGRVGLPTSTVDAALGNRGPSFELQGVVDKHFGDFLLTGNLGFRGLPKAELENFTLNDQLVARLGAGYAISENGGVSLDFGSRVNLAQVATESTPIEGILGGYGRAGDFMIRGGAGTGLTPGFGSPRFRLIAGFAYEPPREKDSDADGILDADDRCPDQPEDIDAFEDTDGCPDPTRVKIVVKDEEGNVVSGASWKLTGVSEATGASGDTLSLTKGAYNVMAAAEGYEAGTASAKVPDAKDHLIEVMVKKVIPPTTLMVSVKDDTGAPISGATFAVREEGLRDQPVGEKVGLSPGRYSVRVEATGYRPNTKKVELREGQAGTLEFVLTKAKVEIQKDRIDIKDSVYFLTAKADIKPESFGLLDEVAQILIDHPELLKVRVEGHTDSRGSASYNLRLSKSRAASVRQYLVDRGVADSRLVSEGYGESKPLDTANNEAAWSKNRRVDFFVVERSDD